MKAWQWQVDGYVISGVIYMPRVDLYTEGSVHEFHFEAVAHYPPTYDGEGAYFLGRLIDGNYVKCYMEEKGCGDPLKSLFGAKSPGKRGSR